jgi:threonine dehydrogenase-like Zn-dependent dehydrogenase
LGPGQRGLPAVIAANESGCDPIITAGLPADADRLDLASDFGATHTVDTGANSLSERVADITDGRGVDLVLDTTPGATQPVLDAIDVVRPGGTVVLAGTKGNAEVPGFVSDDLIYDNITVKGTLGTRSWSFERAIEVIEGDDYDLEAFHTHTLPLSDIERAIRLQGGEIDDDAFHVTVTPDA